MMGEKTLREIKAEIRDAFAKKGIDVETWLDQQMAKLKRGPRPQRRAVETLQMLRDGLRPKDKSQSPSKRKSKKPHGKKKPAA